MPLPFGFSIGDFIAVGELASTIPNALSDSRVGTRVQIFGSASGLARCLPPSCFKRPVSFPTTYILVPRSRSNKLSQGTFPKIYRNVSVERKVKSKAGPQEMAEDLVVYLLVGGCKGWISFFSANWLLCLPQCVIISLENRLPYHIFHDVLEIMFRGLPGYKSVIQREYEIGDSKGNIIQKSE
ncbi:hypothetical protein K440DRAFT_636536 [Wilcoxina mikolae CBS 423.85]|nr:hypothetical protein K440DRAFT_636536 [Wilcoxina mikolae CBS 423.85]